MWNASEQISELVAQAGEFLGEKDRLQTDKTALDHDFFPVGGIMPLVGFKDLREALGLNIERAVINLRIIDHPWKRYNSELDMLEYNESVGQTSNYILSPTCWTEIYALFEIEHYECAGRVTFSFVRASDEWFAEKLREFEAKKSVIPFRLLLLNDSEVLRRTEGMRDLFEEGRPALEEQLRRIDEANRRRNEGRRLKEDRRNRNIFLRLYRFFKNR